MLCCLVLVIDTEHFGWQVAMPMHCCIQATCLNVECRYMGQAAVVADAMDSGQSGSSSASTSRTEPDTAAAHFAGIL